MPCSVVLIDRAFNGESKHVVRIARGAEFNLQIAGAVVHKEPFVVQLQRFVAAEFNILQAKICAVLRAAHCISFMSRFAAGLNRPLGPYNFTAAPGIAAPSAAAVVIPTAAVNSITKARTAAASLLILFIFVPLSLFSAHDVSIMRVYAF